MGKLSNGLRIPGVFEKDGRYYRVLRNRWLPLSRIDEGESALYRALFELDPARPGTLGDLMRLYLANGMDQLKPATQVAYTRSVRRLIHHFGHMDIGDLRPSEIAVWLEKRRKKGRGAVNANREFAVLSSVHHFGMRQGWLESNPCAGIRRNPEKPRRRYVTDAEFRAAFEASPEPFQDLLAAAYLSGVRQGDLVALKRTDLQPQGWVFVESKTGKPHTKEWSDALRFFVRRALERFPEAETVFCNRFGQPWGVWAINSQMRRLGVTWAFRDLRAKAQSDSAHSVLGHRGAMEGLYRKVLTTRPVR